MSYIGTTVPDQVVLYENPEVREASSIGRSSLPTVTPQTWVASMLILGTIGYFSGCSQKQAGDKYRFGVGRGVASVLFPGVAAYQVGRYFAHHR